MGKLLWVSGFFLLISATTNLCLGCFQHERRALNRFRGSLTSDPDDRLSSWKGNKCCEWRGVGCDNATGHVTRLDLGSYDPLYDEQVQGNELDLALTELTRLSYLDLSVIDFRSSPIPKFIGSLSKLRFLKLSFTGFSGVVPHELGNLSSLRVLDLSYNTNLAVDDFTWFTRLLALQRLDLSGLKVVGARNLDKVLLYMIPSLRSLRLKACELSNSHFDHTHLDSNLTLSTIQKLDLSNNSFQGEFPFFLQNLTALRILDLSQNRFNSSIPVMNNILELDLSTNSFHRIQDTGIWRLCRIKRLDLSGNYMEGELTGPSTNVSECATFSLETLILGFNWFMGEIPTSLFERLGALKKLDLGFNKGLMGTIPEALGNLRSLQELDLSWNKLTGSIPSSLSNLVELRYLDLSQNLLNGPIPFFMGRLSNLEILYLNSNSFSTIPSSLGNLSQLQFLDLSENVLQRPLPDTMGQLSKLQFLDISNTSLSGVVTEAHFANTSMLKHMSATSNHMLSFKISPHWNPPFQIRIVLLKSCKIESEFPAWIRTQKSLVVLDLSNTSIHGPLPVWFRDLPILASLDLSHNFLDGPLTNLPFNQTLTETPSSFPLIEKLAGYKIVSRVLLLKNNLFNGSIPDSLCNATDLVILDLSKNSLSGTLPDCFGNLREMNVIILGSNRLSGAIPRSLGNLGSSLQWLQLNNNRFHGQLPETLANCTRLDVLDLGENRFSGSIPKWIGENMDFLVVLRLHKNGFTGQIPVELCESSKLQIMDLGNNNLTGMIPRCFEKLSRMIGGEYDLYSEGSFEGSLIQVMKGVQAEYTTTMKYVVNMDLSSNKLVGEIPKELVLLSGLVNLNLSNNHLTGHIPNRIGDMKSLFSFDLSLNNLSGTIPQSISALTFLSHLNLSHNSLSGRIPTGSQLQTFIDPSIYAANYDLWGCPLPIKCNRNHAAETGINTEKDDDDDVEEMWIYSVTSGYITGFMGILGILALKKRWRRVIFNFVGSYIDKEL